MSGAAFAMISRWLNFLERIKRLIHGSCQGAQADAVNCIDGFSIDRNSPLGLPTSLQFEQS